MFTFFVVHAGDGGDNTGQRAAEGGDFDVHK
jgi:hypothetical protein